MLAALLTLTLVTVLPFFSVATVGGGGGVAIVAQAETGLLELIKKASDLSTAVYFYHAELLEETFAAARVVEVEQELDLADFASSMRSYSAGPDVQALMAEWNNEYCVVAFRGTAQQAADPSILYGNVLDNILGSRTEVCLRETDNDCCAFRTPYVERFYADDAFFQGIKGEVEACGDRTVVFTGHSAGATMATIAHVFYADLNPYTITFGEAPSVVANNDECLSVVNSERIFRFLNTNNGDTGPQLEYDSVATAQPWYAPNSATTLGRLFLLSDDASRAAYIGTDVAIDNNAPTCGEECHSMTTIVGVTATANLDSSTTTPGVAVVVAVVPGYRERINALYAASEFSDFTFDASGFHDGSYCHQDVECESRRCDTTCHARLTETCAFCNEDSDCVTGHCDKWWFRPCLADNRPPFLSGLGNCA